MPLAPVLYHWPNGRLSVPAGPVRTGKSLATISLGCGFFALSRRPGPVVLGLLGAVSCMREGNGMKRLSALLSAVAVVWAATANAADLPAAGPAPSYSPVYRPHIYDWTGFYFGAHIGAGRQDNSYTDTTTTALENAGNVSSHGQYGTVGGGQIGVNYQMTPVVVGLEGTWSATSLTGYWNFSSRLLSRLVVWLAACRCAAATINWFATATARVGFALTSCCSTSKAAAPGCAPGSRATFS